METRLLEAAVTVAEELSFRRAARRLHIAQPALSQQIQRLERELGTALFDRDRRHVALTPSGVRFLPRARALLQQLDDLADSTRDDGHLTGRLIVGTLRSAPASAITRHLATFSREHPGVVVELRQATSDVLLDELRLGNLDAAIVGVQPQPPLGSVVVISEPLVAIVPEDSALPRTRAVPIARCAGARLVLYEPGNGLRTDVINLLDAESVEMPVAFETGDMLTIVELVRSADVVAFIPTSTAATLDLSGVRVLKVSPAPVRRVWAAWPEARRRSHIAQRLLEHSGLLTSEQPEFTGR